MANLIVVRASTDPCHLVKQISEFIRQAESLVLMALGTGSVFVAITAIGVARFQLTSECLDLVFVTELCDLDEDGNQRSALWVYSKRPGRRFGRLRHDDPGKHANDA